jgi:hypothetical protein
VLARHRGGLDAVARALLDEETIDGETVGRLVDTAYGRPVHEHGIKTVPPIFVASQHGPTGSGDADGPPEGPPGSPPVPATGAADTGQTATSGTDTAAEPADDGVPTASRADDEPGATQPTEPSPWPPPAPPAAGHWPQAPSPLPAQPAPGHWPTQSPWPPPPPPPTSR